MLLAMELFPEPVSDGGGDDMVCCTGASSGGKDSAWSSDKPVELCKSIPCKAAGRCALAELHAERLCRESISEKREVRR